MILEPAHASMSELIDELIELETDAHMSLKGAEVEQASIWFKNGKPIKAVYGSISGEEALRLILGLNPKIGVHIHQLPTGTVPNLEIRQSLEDFALNASRHGRKLELDLQMLINELPDRIKPIMAVTLEGFAPVAVYPPHLMDTGLSLGFHAGSGIKALSDENIFFIAGAVKDHDFAYAKKHVFAWRKEQSWTMVLLESSKDLTPFRMIVGA